MVDMVELAKVWPEPTSNIDSWIHPVSLIVSPTRFDSELISVQYTVLVTGSRREGKD